MGEVSVVSALVLALTFLSVPVAVAAETYEVAVGKLLDASGSPESMHFFPQQLKIHQGDTLHFTSNGFHTASLLPLGQDPDEWMSSHWTGRTGEWSLVQSDPDEGAGALKLNSRVALPSRIDCGQAGQSACSYDGEADPVDGVLNSGLPGSGPFDFTVTITAAPGETMWAVDLVTGMRMEIEVVDAGVSATTSSEVTAANTAQTQADTATANRLHRTYSAKRVKTTRGGKVTWKAWAGVDANGVVLRSMYPKSLPVKKGNFVQWNFNKLLIDAHTVTFPQTQAQTMLSSFPEIACDPDADSGSGPDTPPDQPSAPFCDDPRQVELDIPGSIMDKQGPSAVANATTFAHSGVRGAAPLAVTKAAYKLRFTKPSGKKGFSYACVLHPTMSGKVIVK